MLRRRWEAPIGRSGIEPFIPACCDEALPTHWLGLRHRGACFFAFRGLGKLASGALSPGLTSSARYRISCAGNHDLTPRSSFFERQAGIPFRLQYVFAGITVSGQFHRH
jgi:hypothetical protein